MERLMSRLTLLLGCWRLRWLRLACTALPLTRLSGALAKLAYAWR